MKNPERQRAGRRGGQATLAKYGREHFRNLGRRGGRPKLPSLADLQRQQSASEDKNTKIRRKGPPAFFSLKTLRKLLKNKIERGSHAAGSP